VLDAWFDSDRTIDDLIALIAAFSETDRLRALHHFASVRRPRHEAMLAPLQREVDEIFDAPRKLARTEDLNRAKQPLQRTEWALLHFSRNPGSCPTPTKRRCRAARTRPSISIPRASGQRPRSERSSKTPSTPAACTGTGWTSAPSSKATGRSCAAIATIAELDDDRSQRTGLDLDDACAVLDGLPNLRETLAAADPKLRRQVYDAFRLSVEINRNEAQIRLKALVSSAFTGATDLEALVAHKAIAGGTLRPYGRLRGTGRMGGWVAMTPTHRASSNASAL
jgi:hypothetical protein